MPHQPSSYIIAPTGDASLTKRESLASVYQALRYRTVEYPKEMWYFIACFIFLLFLVNVYSRLSLSLKKRLANPTAISVDAPSPNGRISWRRLNVATLNAWRIVAFRTDIGFAGFYTLNLTELFTTLAYIAALFTWSIVNSRLPDGEYRIGYRTGTMAASQFPLIVGLGMRNNIISWLTGIGAEKLNYLHRMCARAVMILLWVHAGTWFKAGLEGLNAITTSRIRWAIVAVACLTVICFVALRPIRTRAYEAFYATHNVLVFVMLIGAYVHTNAYGLGFYIWPVWVLWGFDRLLRAIRLFAFNHNNFPFFSRRESFNATVSTVAPGFMLLRFRRPSHLHWSPGQHAFISIPSISSMPFESHPFTIANIDSEMQSGLSGDKTPTDGKEVTFIIKAQTGFTARLEKAAEARRSHTVFFNGPYGSPPDLSFYDTVVFIAGGSGISFTSPLFADLLLRCKANPSICQSVVFVWSVRQIEHIDLIYDTLARALDNTPSTLQIQVYIHVTGTSAQTSMPSSSSNSSNSSMHEKTTHALRIERLSYTKLAYGKADVSTVLDEACALAKGRVAVNVCGPSALVSDVKRALRSPMYRPLSILRGEPSVNLFVETFGY